MLTSLPTSAAVILLPPLGGSYEFLFYIFKKLIIRTETMKIAQALLAFKWLGQIQNQD